MKNRNLEVRWLQEGVRSWDGWMWRWMCYCEEHTSIFKTWVFTLYPSLVKCPNRDMHLPTDFRFPKPEIKEYLDPNPWTVQLDHDFPGQNRCTHQNALPKQIHLETLEHSKHKKEREGFFSFSAPMRQSEHRIIWFLSVQGWIHWTTFCTCPHCSKGSGFWESQTKTNSFCSLH